MMRLEEHNSAEQYNSIFNYLLDLTFNILQQIKMTTLTLWTPLN
jgi:hypothetical protein